MKKILPVVLATALALVSLAACGSQAGTQAAPENANASQTEEGATQNNAESSAQNADATETTETTGTSEITEMAETTAAAEAPAEETEEIPVGHIRPDDYDPTAEIGQPGWYPTAQGLVDYCLKWKDLPHCYSWDANGQYLTSEFLDQYSAWYPDWFGVDDRLALRREIQDQGIRAFDCIGIIKAYVWGDYSQDNTSRRTDETNYYCKNVLQQGTPKGPIRELPEVPGIVVWKKGHVGIYLGDGKVIECTQQYYPSTGESKVGGIIISDLRDRGWAYWVEYPGILYLDEENL